MIRIFAGLIFVFIVYVINRANGFCYNTNSKIVFSPERNYSESSYFGYTTLMRDGEDPTIVVGAPRDNSNYAGHNNIKNPGAIYICLIDLYNNNITCSQKILDATGNTQSRSPPYLKKKDNMWLGMSMAGTTNNNGSLVMCAPRWIVQYYRDFYSSNGLCYSITNTKKQSATTTTTLTPLTNPKQQILTLTDSDSIARYGKHAYNYAFGQAGVSSEVSADGTELLIGAPGIFHWTGSVIKYTITKDANGNVEFLNPRIPNPYYTSDLTDSLYLGYSVGFGNFIGKRKDIYVAGAPRGADYKGEVYIFAFPRQKRGQSDADIEEKGALNIQTKLEGKTIGEYFGSTIATIDINQDGLTDLIIGAPMYAETLRWDVGRVYVYMNGNYGSFIEQDVSICGSYQNGARFGTSISDIGDINGDGFIDVAIGAPYENHNSGAVYIYLGIENGLNPKYVQRITMDKMMGFGISISKGVDIDKNLCKDIAIGAHKSGHVVLLRCHPSVDVVPKIETIPHELSLNDTELTAKICIKFKGHSQYKTELDVNLYVDHEYKRVAFADRNDAVLLITGMGEDETCKDIRINIQPNRIDYSRPIEIKMTYKLKNDPIRENTFCPNCTVIGPTRSHNFSMRVPIAVACGDDLICHSDLKLKVECLSKLPFVIGTSQSIKLNISLENIGEPAFLAQVQILPSAKAPIQQVPPRCYLQEPLLICDFDNPFLSDSQINKFIVVEFSTSLLMNTDEMLTFNITATSGGEELTPDDNNIIFNVPLKSIAALEIDSKVAPSQFIYINESDTETIQNLSIVHSFEIINTGPSNLNVVTFRFFLPVAYLDESSKIVYNIMNVHEPKAYIDNQLMICDLIRGTYFNDKTEFLTDDIFDESTETEDTTTFKSTTVENIIPLMDEDIFIRYEKYISFLNTSDRVNVSFTSLDINCIDTEHVSCSIVECRGALHTIGSNGAEIHFNMDVNQTIIGILLKENHFITLSSYAMADSMFNPNGRVYNWARSYISTSNPTSAKIPLWLIGFSLGLGMVSLFILICLLSKCGFFKRKKIKTNDSTHLIITEEDKDDTTDDEMYKK